jgi:hypothetical protein
MQCTIQTSAAFALGASVAAAGAEVTIHEEFGEWQAATPGFITVDFADLAQFTIVSDQYAGQGVLFPDGDDVVFGNDFITFPLDGVGIDGQGQINVEFLAPRNAIALHFTSVGVLRLYDQGSLIHESPTFSGGPGTFLGFSSDQSFDSASIVDVPNGSLRIDNLYFGVPAPGALALLTLAGAIGPRRRWWRG